MDKYDMISKVITKIDKLVDARGMEKCSLGVEVVQLLSTLAKGLGDEDKAHKAEKKLLEDQLKPRPLAEGEIREGGETITYDLEPEELKEAEHGAGDGTE